MFGWLCRCEEQRLVADRLQAENETLRAERDELRLQCKQLVDSDIVQRNLIRALRSVNAALDERLVERETVNARQFLVTSSQVPRGCK